MNEKASMSAGQSTEWNMAIAYLQRLDEIIKFCGKSSHENNFKAWHKGINSFYSDLYAWMTKEEVTAADKLIDPLAALSTTNADANLKSKKFHAAERFLRVIMHKKGMDLPIKKTIVDTWQSQAIK